LIIVTAYCKKCGWRALDQQGGFEYLLNISVGAPSAAIH
jgi:hypothetical protein